MDTETPAAAPVEIPLGAVNEDILREIVREFILREGTDYGAVEVGLDAKINQVLAQLKRGDATLYFDPDTESVTLNPAGRRR